MALYIMAARHLRAFLTLLIWESFVVCDGTVSIASSNAFITQRHCVRRCIMGASNGIDLGCGSPLRNSCFCRVDVQSAALYQVSSCVSVNCKGTATDINNVISLYTAYCSTWTLSSTSAAATSSDAENDSTASTTSETATAANTTATNSGTENDRTVSITSSNAYATQRPCIQSCVMEASNGIGVGCGNPLLNSCFCSTDLSNSILYQVSSCVSVNCNGTTTDINNVISLYTVYCSTATLSTTSATGTAANTTATDSGVENDPTVSIASSNAYCHGATTDINNAISLYTLYCSSDTLTASMVATSSPGEAQPSVTSSKSSAAQSTGKSCSWLLRLILSWHGAWALGNPLEIIQRLTLAAFSEFCWRRRRGRRWRRRRHIKGRTDNSGYIHFNSSRHDSCRCLGYLASV